jgi:glutamate/tyrosine decarboxylase-like PLP-dependent enzyme
MNRQGRIQSAQTWTRQYTGKNIIKGYAKHFGVSKVCAALELKMIGIPIEETETTKLKAAEQAIAKQRQQKRRIRQTCEEGDGSVWEEFEETPLIYNGSDAHACRECEI